MCSFKGNHFSVSITHRSNELGIAAVISTGDLLHAVLWARLPLGIWQHNRFALGRGSTGARPALHDLQAVPASPHGCPSRELNQKMRTLWKSSSCYLPSKLRNLQLIGWINNSNQFAMWRHLLENRWSRRKRKNKVDAKSPHLNRAGGHKGSVLSGKENKAVRLCDLDHLWETRLVARKSIVMCPKPSLTHLHVMKKSSPPTGGLDPGGWRCRAGKQHSTAAKLLQQLWPIIPSGEPTAELHVGIKAWFYAWASQVREIEAFDMFTLQKVTSKIREHTEGAARTFQGLMKKNIVL